ncbi:MAG: hypothetical protein Q4A03_10610 [Rothia sp. (in: high G+C Gram-positive bacteria)]|uniref:thermonuclease family protein n=1 Tax=Rothia sp. (in: high G+C Gram-positive bacteria) TaxID=1885016 RepID=UPI0026FA147E|nr:hypothetical protein [Rothia sp. (in: high G+C Gram-positive bacteria)]
MRPARIFAPATLAVSMFTLTACGLFDNAAEPVSTATPNAIDSTSVARVVRVIDADTLSMERNGTTITVDLLGLATPQTKHENEDMRCLPPNLPQLTQMLPTRAIHPTLKTPQTPQRALPQPPSPSTTVD